MLGTEGRSSFARRPDGAEAETRGRRQRLGGVVLAGGAREGVLRGPQGEGGGAARHVGAPHAEAERDLPGSSARTRRSSTCPASSNPSARASRPSRMRRWATTPRPRPTWSTLAPAAAAAGVELLDRPDRVAVSAAPDITDLLQAWGRRGDAGRDRPHAPSTTSSTGERRPGCGASARAHPAANGPACMRPTSGSSTRGARPGRTARSSTGVASGDHAPHPGGPGARAHRQQVGPMAARDPRPRRSPRSARTTWTSSTSTRRSSSCRLRSPQEPHRGAPILRAACRSRRPARFSACRLATVERDWQVARAWLFKALSGRSGPSRDGQIPSFLPPKGRRNRCRLAHGPSRGTFRIYSRRLTIRMGDDA